jgi:hypothetical protein
VFYLLGCGNFIDGFYLPPVDHGEGQGRSCGIHVVTLSALLQGIWFSCDVARQVEAVLVRAVDIQ